MKKMNFILFVLIFLCANSLFSQYTKEWVAVYNSLTGGYNYFDRPTASVVDKLGNVYITGSMYDEYNSENNFVTLKYDANGILLWHTIHDTANRAPYSLAVDNQGNVYVSGGSYFKIIKYNSLGEIQWISRELNIQAGVCRSIAVDSLGNIYAAGENFDEVQFVNIITAKYNSNGIKQWLKVYSNPVNNSDYSKQLKLDKYGNVYVVGRTYMDNSNYETVTLKYSNQGTLLWNAIFDESINYDLPAAIDIDDSCNVIVTGAITTNYSQLDYDFFTVKYNPDGDSLWVRKYNGFGVGYGNSTDIPVDVRIGNFSDIYVTGYSVGNGTGNDFTTIKYNADGDSLWVRRYTNNNSDDKPKSFAVDRQNNFIYVTGTSDSNYATVKYDQNGNLLWLREYAGEVGGIDEAKFVNLDMSGNIMVAGYSFGGRTNDDYYTIKYNSTGNVVWAKRFTTPYVSLDGANAMILTGNNEICVTGKSEVDSTSSDIFTIKYNSSGQQIWTARYNDNDSRDDEALSMDSDSQGNIFVTGYGTLTNGTKDVITLKYSPTGTQQWVQRYNGQYNLDDVGNKITVDKSGNIIVCGYTSVSTTNTDLLLIKYNNSGNILWTKTFDGPISGADEGRVVRTDSLNNIYTGGFTTAGTGNTDYLICKYSTDGEVIWIRTYHKLKSDVVNDLIIGDTSNVYMAGRSYEANSIPPYYFSVSAYAVTLKYGFDGVLIWNKEYGGSAFNQPVEYGANALTANNGGNILVAAYKNYPTYYKTMKFDANGEQLWTGDYYNSVNGGYAKFISFYGENEIFVTGCLSGENTGYDIVTIRVKDSNGVADWNDRYNNFSAGNDYPNAMAVDSAGNIYIAGESESHETGTDFVIIKYSRLIGIGNSGNSVPARFELCQNYPNPFNPISKIKYQIAILTNVKFVIFDVLGREIEILVNETQKPGSYEVTWDGSKYASGVYFYRLITDEWTETKKMILLK